MMDKFNPRYAQNMGYLLGGVVTLLGLLWVLLPGWEEAQLGPMNTGHENVACEACHAAAPGTMRAQIQANVRYALGLRQTPAVFGHEAVANAACQACHERPVDNHPVFRFNEPRFAEARAAIHPEQCVSCHLEHQGKRVTIDQQYCQYCHDPLEVQNDPITWVHSELAAAQRWDTCLGCHDFHGNHVMDLETIVAKALTEEQIQAYFDGAPSPYSDTRFFYAKESPDE